LAVGDELSRRGPGTGGFGLLSGLCCLVVVVLIVGLVVLLMNRRRRGPDR
jgi:hypothetical protein